MIPNFNLPQLELGPIAIDAFGVLVSCGFVVGTILAARRARLVGLSEQALYDMGLLCLIFGIAGAHWVVTFVYRFDDLLKRPLWFFEIWSGISSWGGFLGAGIAILIYTRTRKLPFLKYADALMFGFFPGWFLGRIGCFTAHDHIGRLSNFFLAVNFPKGARHDLGLYEALATLPLIALIYYLGRKKNSDSPAPGVLFFTAFLVYCFIRFSLDFLRAADLPLISETRYFGLTPAQYFCLAGGLFASAMLMRKMSNRRRNSC